MRKTFPIVFTLIAGLLAVPSAEAAVPGLIPVQGILADTDGNPIDAATNLTFSLYAAETAGVALWTDTFEAVDVVDGFFTVYLGDEEPLDFASLIANEEIWVGIAVASDPEMNRIQLAAVPFAVEAEVCERVGSLTEEDINANFVASTAPAAAITTTQVTDWDEAHSWGDHASAGYLTSYTETDPEFAASVAFEIDITDVGNWNTAYGWGNHASAGYLKSYTETDPVYAASAASNVTNTSISNWNTAYGWGNHAGLYATSTHNHAAADITSGTLANARVNWAAPGNIGATTAASGAFTSVSASNGLSVTNGTVTLRPSGSGGTNGQVLTTNGAGVATWQNAPVPAMSVTTQNANYTILPTDGLIITNGGVTFTLPTAAAAGAGKTIYLYSKVSTITLLPPVGNTIWDNSGVSHTHPSTMTSYNGMYVSDGVSTWYEVTK